MSDYGHLMMHPNPPRKQLARVIFDKAGAVIVQTGSYDLSQIVIARRHLSPTEAAQHILEWLDGSHCVAEEANDPTALVKPTSDDLRSGRYLVTNIDEWDPQLEAVARDLKVTGWPNAAEFASRLVSEEA